jgi:hypothetical protein
LRIRSEDLIRAGTAAFFIAVFGYGKIILTPELTTDLVVINWLQALIAAGMFWRGTMAFSACGIAVLFAAGIYYYGTFHMMDYPIFLGLAAYLAMTGTGRSEILGLRPIDVARICTGITLLWASVEKWAYPQWSFPLLHAHTRLSLGFAPDFYMTASGVIEFALAFGLLWTPLVRRLSAIVLCAMFLSAVLEFGKIDAIGHFPIIILLLAIIADDQPAPARSPVLVPSLYCATLVAFVAAYYGAHAALLPAGESAFAHRPPAIGMSIPGPASPQTTIQ